MDIEVILDSDLGKAVIESIVEKAVKQYRIAACEAWEIVATELGNQPILLKAIQSDETLQKIQRTSAYRALSTAAKKKIYYTLRQYKGDEQILQQAVAQLKTLAPGTASTSYCPVLADILQNHASTKERLEEAASFYEQLSALIGQPSSLLDVGCGVHPLMFPFEQWPFLTDYKALDRDQVSVSAIQAFAPLLDSCKLTGQVWQAKDGFGSFEKDAFDVALFLKLIPVITRQEQDALDILLQTPAPVWVVSGSRIALAKQQNIERREKRIVEQFVQRSGKQVIGEFEIETEFVWVLG